MDIPSIFKERFSHPRWKVVYCRSLCGDVFSLEECVRGVQSQFPYLVECASESEWFVESSHVDHVVYLGLPCESQLIRDLVAGGRLSVPSHPEGYGICSCHVPGHEDLKMLVISSETAAGLLYGVEYFNSEIIGCKPYELLGSSATKEYWPERLELLAHAADWQVSDHPRIDERGIWTWGYPIYDYRHFLDNMARLRMNSLIVWNDRLPVNFQDMLDYAAKRHVSVIPGFHWGWGRALDVSDPDVMDELTEHVLGVLKDEFSGISLKSIYFQTLTEFVKESGSQENVAELTCRLVNHIGGEVLKAYPGLRILFGVHAISIQGTYPSYEKLDPRISLVWEDAGCTPYSIEPVKNIRDSYRGWWGGIDTEEKTVAYTRNICRLRDRKEFMIVAKGFPNIIWDEFENHRGFVLGARTPFDIRRSLESRREHWNRCNRNWLKNYDCALHVYQAMLEEQPREKMVTMLIEDGMFEAKIQDCVAMAAAILWNPTRPAEEYLKFYHNNFYALFDQF